MKHKERNMHSESLFSRRLGAGLLAVPMLLSLLPSCYDGRVGSGDEATSSSSDALTESTNSKLKTGIILALGKIPEVGIVFQELTNILWPGASTDTPLNDTQVKQVRDIAKEVVDAAIAKEHVTDLASQIQDIKNKIISYQKAVQDASQDDIAFKFRALVEYVQLGVEVKYATTDYSTASPGYFVVLGTQALSVLREDYLFHGQITGSPVSDKARADAYDLLVKFIGVFTRGREDLRTFAMNTRLAKVKLTAFGNAIGGGMTVSDTAEGSTYQPRTFFYSSDPLGFAAKAEYARLRTQVRNDYSASFSDSLGAAESWEYFDPNKKPDSLFATTVKTTTGPFGRQTLSFFDDHPDAGGKADPYARYITNVNMKLGTMVDSVQIGYSDGWSPVHGNGALNNGWTLAPGERIVGAAGRFGNTTDRLIFTTNAGRALGGFGGGGSTSWTASPASDLFNRSLYDVEGYATATTLDQVTFHWVGTRLNSDYFASTEFFIVSHSNHLCLTGNHVCSNDDIRQMQRWRFVQDSNSSSRFRLQAIDPSGTKREINAPSGAGSTVSNGAEGAGTLFTVVPMWGSKDRFFFRQSNPQNGVNTYLTDKNSAVGVNFESCGWRLVPANSAVDLAATGGDWCAPDADSGQAAGAGASYLWAGQDNGCNNTSTCSPGQENTKCNGTWWDDVCKKVGDTYCRWEGQDGVCGNNNAYCNLSQSGTHCGNDGGDDGCNCYPAVVR